MKTRLSCLLLALGALLTPCLSAKSAREMLSDWPAGSSPVEVGRRITENYLERDFLKHRAGTIVYPEVCVWYGALTYARYAGAKDLREKLIQRFDPLLSPEGAQLISNRAHVDYRVFGIVPLEIFRQNKDERFLKIGRDLADAQWKETTDDGITKEARYWIDDMYMIPVLQVQAFRATKDTRYLDRAALAMVAYLEKLQQDNGLFLHAPDSPFYWGRGNGWFAAGMAELLSELPENHPQRAAVLKGFRRMMASLLRCQAESGLWRQLVDKPESWEETSGSAMFAFGMITGVKQGWLDTDTYGPAARKAWLALVAKLDKEAELTEVCVGTDKGFKVVGPELDKQLAFYLARERKAGDRHGQAPMLWCATALLK